jgi:hypothetical protein
MKSTLKLVAIVLLAGVLLNLSCKKEYICKGCPKKNLAPVAIAGPGQINVLTLCNVTLDGSSSFDNDGTLSSTIWTQLSGPGQAVIKDPNLLVTTVSGLKEGVYDFMLKVTDNKGAVGYDTLQIMANKSLSGFEIIYNSKWGCNDLCRDGDVYWTNSESNRFCDSNIPLQVSIRLDTSSVWIDVHNVNSPLPPINQFYWQIDRGYLWVFAYEGRLIGTTITIKAKFL